MPGLKRLSIALVLPVCAVLAACTPAPDGVAFHDPYESNNRANHELNKSLDTNVVRPLANGYGTVVPDPIRTGVSNFSANLSLPGQIINNVLQADLRGAGQNTARFLMNSTVGLVGLFDPATAVGLFEEDADFGETLAVWGVGEGAYVELPLLGPSTERDAIGKIVDFALNPLRGLETPESTYVGVAGAGSGLDQRYRLGDTIDGVLYGSADSYAQSRLIYLQNRRFEVGGDVGTPVEDPYLDPYIDPYADLGE